MTSGKEQTADEKEKVSEQNADQTVENNDVAQLPKNEEMNGEPDYGVGDFRIG